jgi:hypothetical protein
MKKVFAAIMLLAYFTVSTGFTVNLHYCMNQLASWDLGHGDNERCGSCGMKVKKASGCCKNEVKVVKLQQDMVGAHAIAFNFSIPALSHHSFEIFTTSPSFLEREYVSSLAHGPPLISKQDTYLRNCVFRL